MLLKLIKIEPKIVTLFVADKWKYDLVSGVKRIIKETRADAIKIEVFSGNTAGHSKDKKDVIKIKEKD